MVGRLHIVLLLLLVSARVLAIDALVSHAVFYLPDPSRSNKLMPSVEMYWQVNPHSVHYTTTPEKSIIARIKTDIYISNEIGQLKEDHFILQTVPCASVAELTMHSIIDLRRYFVTPGYIKMRLVFTDMADTLHHFKFADSFTVAPVPDNTAFLSDVQLLDTVIESPAHTPFEKNGHQQVPACANFLDDSRSQLHYYAELYRTDKVPKVDYPLIQKVTVKKKVTENPFPGMERIDTIKAKELSIASGSFPIGRLPSGNYHLNVTLENNSKIIVASSDLFFQRLNTHPIKDDTARMALAAMDTGIENINVLNLNKTFLEKYNSPQITAILKMLLPVSDPLGVQTINGFLKNPEDLYMRYYIYNYFQGINKHDPARAWKEYAERIKEVNALFSEHGTVGYETERGMIYLRYGAPTERITVENETGALPYEVWQYNQLTERNKKEVADAVFLFYRPSQTLSGFRLLHSSVAGEMQNAQWRSYLYVTGDGGNSGNSRAEQYIGNK